MDQHWTTKAACRGEDPETFFPEIYYRSDFERFKELRDKALGFCARCPVRETCLLEALRNNERHGIWGGTLRHERDRMRGIKRKRDREKTA